MLALVSNTWPEGVLLQNSPSWGRKFTRRGKGDVACAGPTTPFGVLLGLCANPVMDYKICRSERHKAREPPPLPRRVKGFWLPPRARIHTLHYPLVTPLNERTGHRLRRASAIHYPRYDDGRGNEWMQRNS